MIGSTTLVSAVVLTILFCGIANAQGNPRITRVPLRRENMLQNSIQFINPEMPEAVYGQILSANTGFGGVSPFRRFNGAPGTVFLANNEAPSVPDQHIITSNGGIFTMEAPDVPSFGSAFVSPFSGIGGLSLNGIVASPLNGIDRNVVLQRPGLNRNVVTTRNGPVIIDSAELGHGLRRY